MSFDFIKYRESQNLYPVEILSKEKYLDALVNIEQSWTSRVDAQISHTFFLESVQLITNAIVLFEKGYFDCGYYSLRQSLEISTTIIYLIDLDEEQREIELTKWTTKDKFPMYGQMIELLDKNKASFSNIKNQMSAYFEKLQLTKQKLNKYVHKQGFNTFYVSRNHFLMQSKSRDNIVAEFEKYIKVCIGAVAVFRLAIDPFPVLLMDEEIYHRTIDLLTEPFSEEFIENYIGIENIELYKQTEIYKAHYDYFIKQEKKLQSVTAIVKHQYIDKTKIDEINTQVHLLNEESLIALFYIQFSDKVSKVHFEEGLNTYFTNIPSKRNNNSYSSLTIKMFQESPNKFNQDYEGAFASVVSILNKACCIEHNEIFTEEEIMFLSNPDAFAKSIVT